MDFYFNAPIWDETSEDTPGTDEFACPRDLITVQNVRAIQVINAMYRDAIFNGTFVVSPKEAITLPKEGKHRIEIYCRWYGHRLKTRGPEFLIDMGTAIVTDNYSGEVFTDLRKKAD